MTLLPMLFLVACSASESSESDGSPLQPADGATAAAADATPMTDAMPMADANLSPHAFVEVDGVNLEFDTVSAYEGGAEDHTISTNVGPNCPLGPGCTTLYVSFPGDAQPGLKTCEELLVSVQFNTEGKRFFSFGSAAAFCSFRLDVNDGETIAISGLSARLEENNNPTAFKNLSGGQARAPMN